MKITLIVFTSIIVLLYFISKKEYHEYVAILDPKRYPFKDFAVIGLFILDLIKYQYNTTYDKMLFNKISELSGHREAWYYLKIHLANKIILLLLGTGFILLVGSFTSLDGGFWLFSCILIAAIFYFTDNELDQRIRKKHTAIQIDFPDFLNRLILLINAGMTVSKAWERAITENSKPGPLNEELKKVINEIRGGKPELRAYADFAKRCKTPEITRFVSAMIQNIRKGNAELVSILRIHANDCWQMRINTAKRLGEEASTKMIFPLILMFIAILAIAITPAILTLGQVM